MPHLGLGALTSSLETRPPATLKRVPMFPPHSESIWFAREPMYLEWVKFRAICAKWVSSTRRRRWSPRKASLKAENKARRSASCTLGICSAASNAVVWGRPSKRPSTQHPKYATSKTAASKVRNIQNASKIGYIGSVHNVQNRNIQNRNIQKRIIQKRNIQGRSIQSTQRPST